MKKLMLVLVLLLGTLSFVACGKKDDKGNQCQGYPQGYVQVTDQRMLQLINSGGGYNSGYGYNNGYYNNGYQQQAVCIDQYTYRQLQAQITGNYQNNNQYNCQQNPSAPGCYTNNNGSGSNYGGGGSNSNPYCDYYPEDPYCWGGAY